MENNGTEAIFSAILNFSFQRLQMLAEKKFTMKEKLIWKLFINLYMDNIKLDAGFFLDIAVPPSGM